MAYKVVVHDTAGQRDNSFTAAQEEPTSTTELRSSTGQSTGDMAHAGTAKPRRARKAPAALLQHAGCVIIPTLAKPSPLTEITMKRSVLPPKPI
jgi:hypothetical protein